VEMPTVRMIIALTALGLQTGDACARAVGHSHDPWLAAHVDALPADVRRSLSALQASCGQPRAAHEFSRYLSTAGGRHDFIALHFEHFGCANRAAICTAAGCLHEVFASTRGGYRRVYSAHVLELELDLIGGTPVIAISSGRGVAPWVLRWNGGGFRK